MDRSVGPSRRIAACGGVCAARTGRRLSDGATHNGVPQGDVGGGGGRASQLMAGGARVVEGLFGVGASARVGVRVGVEREYKRRQQ